MCNDELSPPEMAREGIPDFESMPLRDDNPSSVDLLGFSDIVAAVEATITRPDLDPITVGINAPWGGGKTTVLQLLKARLEEREDVLSVYVSPWEYDRTTDPKAALIGAVLGRLDEAVQADATLTDEMRDKLSSLRDRVNVAKAVKLAASSAITMSLPSLDSLAGLFEAGEEAQDPTLQGFREEFGEFLSADALEEVTQVGVLVDDLDRSLPDTVVETLEAIKLFLSVEKMAFVIAADEDNVARAIGQRLESTGQPTTARQYLEKIVHIPFRIPALSRERTEEYLALLMLADTEEIGSLVERVRETRGDAESLTARLGELVPSERRNDLTLAERLAPILHRHTQGNPRRLKRFLNALWVRSAFAHSRGLHLEFAACAKLMIAELLHPDLFAQMLGWLAAGNLDDKVAEIENGDGDHPDYVFRWGQLDPPLQDVGLSEYLLLAASLRGETVEEATLPPDLRDIAADLTSESEVIRDGGIESARDRDEAERSVLVRHVATQLRHQDDPDRQLGLAIVLSALATSEPITRAAVDELSSMDPTTILAPVPIGLMSRNEPPQFADLLRQWAEGSEMRDPTREAAASVLED